MNDDDRSTEHTSPSASESTNSPVSKQADEGPGCFPAFLAIGALLLMAMFIGCGFATWYIFQQRTELALRTLKGDVIPTVQESGMSPDEKAQVVEILQQVVQEGEAGKLENWQSSGIMERLIRSPVLQWGDLELLEATILASDQLSAEEKSNASRQISRLKRAVELGEAGAVDVNDVLSPVHKASNSNELPRFDRNAKTADLKDAITRAKLIADRGNVPEQDFDVDLAKILRREVEAGKSVGGL